MASKCRKKSENEIDEEIENSPEIKRLKKTIANLEERIEKLENENNKYKKNKRDYNVYWKNYLNGSTPSEKKFVEKILFLEDSFEYPEIKPIIEIVKLLCSDEGQDILCKYPDFRNLQLRNMTDYTDFERTPGIPYDFIMSNWDKMFGKYEKNDMILTFLKIRYKYFMFIKL